MQSLGLYMPQGMQNKFRTHNRCTQRDPILVREIRHSHVKEYGRGRVHFELLMDVLWGGMGLRLDFEECGWVRRRKKGIADIRHGDCKSRGRKE